MHASGNSRTHSSDMHIYVFANVNDFITGLCSTVCQNADGTLEMRVTIIGLLITPAACKCALAMRK